MNVHRPTSRVALRAAVAGAAVLAGLLAACSPERILGDAKPPQDYSDPEVARTRDGARASYNAALFRFRQAYAGEFTLDASYSSFVIAAGLISDELQPNFGQSFGADADVGAGFELDRRDLPEVLAPRIGQKEDPEYKSYGNLQRVRGQAREAMGLLEHYAPDLPSALRGQLLASIGYTEIFLADLYCSGIPLSTVDFDGNYTVAAGSTTQEVYEHAVVLLDSAIAMAADSARIVNMARVGKARALLALGRYADAAAAVREVPADFRYEMRFRRSGVRGERSSFHFVQVWDGNVTAADREGMNGLAFVSGGDPRTAATKYATSPRGQALYFPDKYATRITGTAVTALDDSAVVLASGTEARLVEAEARLQAGDVGGWLGALNALRATAITPALPALSDPGTDPGRVDLLFRERAAWLHLTGHRQGDLRRLIRHYGRSQGDVYPSGPYQAALTGAYGSDVDAPIPPEERSYNPRFTGCIARGA